MLKKIRVKNYKSLADFECTIIGGTTLLVGANGSGKSTLFDALALIRDVSIGNAPLVENGRYRAMGKTRTRWNPDASFQMFELEVEGNGGTYNYRLEIDEVGTPLLPRIREERVEFDGRPIFNFEEGNVQLFNDRFEDKTGFTVDWHRSFLASVAERPENTKLTWFKQWLRGLRIFRPVPGSIGGVADTEASFLDESLSNFASWFRRLKQVESDRRYANFRSEVSDAIPGFEGIRLETVGEGRSEIRVEFSPGGREHEYILSELSSGQQLLLAYNAIFRFDSEGASLVCLDEPDNYLSLREIGPLLETLSETVDDGGPQLFVASHHPEFYNRLAETDGIALTADEKHGVTSTPVKKLLEQAPTGLSVADIFARGWED